MTEKTFRTFGLLGRSLGHSLSKEWFTQLFEREGIPAQYLNFEIADIGQLMEIPAAYPDLAGFNVTIPYKEQIIPYLSEMRGYAPEVGAVNVVKVSPLPIEGPGFNLYGYNTDVEGFMEAVSPLVEGLEERRALLFGTGGAAKAIRLGLEKMGFEVTDVSRSAAPGRLTYAEVTPALICETPLLVNATPLGMWPDTDSCIDIPYNALSKRNICFDAVYNPRPTLFLERAAERGAQTCDGLGMLLGQARAAWRIWNEPIN